MVISDGPLEGTSLNTESDIKTGLQQALAQRPKKVIKDASRKASAVLIPIYFQDNQFYILFTKRTELVHHHKGEISFPGGAFDAVDGTLLQTALRESQEEIGLDPRQVEVLGELDDIVTRGSPFIISPFVGVIPPGYCFKPSAFEIAEIIIIPIQALLKKDCRQEGPEVNADGQLITAYIFSHAKYRIVGATARILNQFLNIYAEADCVRPE